jgi:hypothetical protein
MLIAKCVETQLRHTPDLVLLQGRGKFCGGGVIIVR